MSLITLVSSDGKTFQYPLLTTHSLKDLNLDITTDAASYPIPTRDVTGRVLGKVIEWCTHHKNEPVKGADIFEGEIEVSQWDQEFLRIIDRVSHQAVLEIWKAAYYLDIQYLIYLCCRDCLTGIRSYLCGAQRFEMIPSRIAMEFFLQDLNLDIIPDAAAFPIPIRDVTGEVLEKVIEWCTHHKDDPVEMEKEEDSNCVLYPLSPWDEAFFEALRASTTISTMDTVEAASSLELICFIEHAQKFLANLMMVEKTPGDDEADDEVAEDPTMLRKCIDW
ncbi:hypothetical protein PRIPAC_87088 [Pristionchus pacificus]|uniref:Uncharacterized protein n=1 Tax=Pristionchus pacificus TaxID=54126 RepID=A0A2A6B5K0_PRIPA|nr:hypothetical protein PRIPAC_87088 [Pristionchus pacificus]|eukprot:PDM61131.1 hypothetical protein PRIPAC_50573 [Pristionchus pacificus]